MLMNVGYYFTDCSLMRLKFIWQVNTMLANLPCLMDLKAKSLKERHWKMISDVVGSDIKVHKVTLGLLDQNNVYSPLVF